VARGLTLPAVVRDEHTPLDAPSAGPLPRLFGDGGHPTTALAARLVCEALRERPGARALDAGAGTGVLSEVALGAGAHEVVAVDREPEAIALIQRRLPEVLALCRDLGAGLAQLGRFDLVVANLPLPELVALAGELCGAARPGGRVIATGIPLVFAGRVERALVAQGARLRERRALAGWCALVFDQ
jgi:ribosomal protein L11 methyltransferase